MRCFPVHTLSDFRRFAGLGERREQTSIFTNSAILGEEETYDNGHFKLTSQNILFQNPLQLL
jgi:hypothetical protein